MNFEIEIDNEDFIEEITKALEEASKNMGIASFSMSAEDMLLRIEGVIDDE